MTDAEKWKTVFASPIEPASEKTSLALSLLVIAGVGAVLFWKTLSGEIRKVAS